MSIDPQPPLISATVPDWSRETLKPGQWHPGKKLIRTIRRYQAWKTWRPARLGHEQVVRVAMAQVESDQRGGNSAQCANWRWPVHAASQWNRDPLRRRDRCELPDHASGHDRHAQRDEGGLRLRLGGHVDVGAGAKILGAVTIGDHARIGANAVVLSDVPPGATAVGIPAKIIQKRDTATSKSGGDQSRTLDP